MKPRPKQPELTREALLEAAHACFGAQGYAATGIGSLVREAGVTKGALFHHFPDKRSLALAWIGKRLGPALAARWIEALAEAGSLDALKGFFQARCGALDPDDPASMLTALAAETATGDALLRDALERCLADWRSAIQACLERGKAEGWIHRSIAPANEAAFLVSAVAGLTVTQRTRPDEAFRRTQAAAIEAYLDTLRPA